MGLLRYELKKMFLHANGLLFLAIYTFVMVLSTFLTDSPEDRELILYADQYNYYLDQVRGSCTEGTESAFKEEAARLSQAQTAVDRLYEDFYDGRITGTELTEQAAPYVTVLQNKKGFDLIYKQYSYIREDTARRYFVSTNGWNALLGAGKLDFPFLILLILLAAPVFCQEAAGRMEPLLLTAPKGGRRKAAVKIGLVFMVTVLLCLFEFGFRCFFYALEYGLENGDFPLQSLALFGTSTRNISLSGTAWAVLASRCFGALGLAAFVMAVSVWVRKYALSAFLGTALILLPYLGLQLESAKYHMPGPLGFMLAAGFFRGNEYGQNFYTGEAELIFRGVSPDRLFLLSLLQLAAVLILLYSILRRYSNIWAGKRKIRSGAACLLALLLLFPLGGCKTAGQEEPFIYNSLSRMEYKTEQFRVHAGWLDGRQELFFTEKSSGKTIKLVRSPMQDATEIGPAIFGSGRYVYYIKSNLDKSAHSPAVECTAIIKLDTDTFEESILYEKRNPAAVDGFLGLNFLESGNGNNMETGDAFFLDGQDIYTIYSDRIIRIDQTKGYSETLLMNCIGNVAFDGRYIYHAGNHKEIMRYDTVTKEEDSIPGVVTEYFYLTAEEILYRNRQDRDKLYAYGMEDGSVRKVLDRAILSVEADGQHIYFTEMGDLKEYRADRSGENVTLRERE